MTLAENDCEHQFEDAARAAGWDEGGGIIYDTKVFESWKAAVSWSGESGRDAAEQNSRTYDTWKECCKFEDIELSDSVARLAFS